MVVKTQVDRFRAIPWYNWTGSANSVPGASGDKGIYYANGNQDLILSQSHDISRLGHGDVGGSFHVFRRELFESNFGTVWNRTTTNEGNSSANNYYGSYFAHTPVVTNSDFDVPPIALDSELNATGATAISRILPTNPLLGLAVSLAELKREGIPSMVGASLLRHRILRARDAGKEYLNAEFGWRPIVNDILGLADGILTSDELIQKYEAESGKLLHRHYTFPTETSTTTSTASGHYPQPSIVTGFWSGTGTKTTVITTTVERWFSGTFTYYLAPRGTVERTNQLAAKRFGHRLTPEVAWNLAPWSWAADWVGNMGDVIHNVSAFSQDGLVMPYGYLMKRTTIRKTISHYGARMKRNNGTVSCSQTFVSTRKQRAKATPYGFGLNPTSFTGRQWAILTALGLARGHGQSNP